MEKCLILLTGWIMAFAVTTGCATTAATSTPTPIPEPRIESLTQENFMTLLTIQHIQSYLPTEVALTTRIIDYKQSAASVDPTQVVNIDSFYVLSFQTEDRLKGLTLSAIDFDSEPSAREHFEKVRMEGPGLEIMSPPIGDASAQVEANAQGVGSIVVFIKGDKLVQLHTVQPDSEQPLISLAGLEQLAEIVVSRL